MRPVNKVALRQEIAMALPGLRFKVKTVSFMDLARESAVFVSSDAWGSWIDGSYPLFRVVKEIARKHGAIAEW